MMRAIIREYGAVSHIHVYHELLGTVRCLKGVKVYLKGLRYLCKSLIAFNQVFFLEKYIWNQMFSFKYKSTKKS